MFDKKVYLSLSIAAFALTTATAAASQNYQPKEAGTFIVSGRATGVLPDSSGDILAGPTDTGLDVHVGDHVMPTLGFTYFLTDNLAVEAILGATRHEISAQGGGADIEVHETWVLPPVVTLQHHFSPKARVSPYIGAGVNAMIFFGGDDRNGFTVDVDDGFGWALQAGADVALKGPWSLNLDAKKVFFDTEAEINGGAMNADVALDPWVVSAGLSRRF